jgi:hypothetical protein
VTTRLQRFLETWGPVGVRANQLLQEIGLSASASWPASRLTPTGAPLEFGFTEVGGGLRYTVEIAPPGVNPGQRLSDICEFVLGRGILLPPVDLLDRVADLQAHGLLTYGAWLGVRHDGSDDRFKIYAEVPSAAGPAVEDWMTKVLGAPLRLPGPAPRVKMIGLDAGSDRVEVYYASTDMLRTGVSMALDRAGLSGMPASILSVIDGMNPFSAGARLPARDVGFSYAVMQGKPEVAFTLYLVAQKLFGDDQGCTEWIAGRLPGHGDLIQVLSATSPGVTHHGMVGLTVAPGVTRPLLSTGVAAPWMR